jgi:hypothetical protein
MTTIYIAASIENDDCTSEKGTLSFFGKLRDTGEKVLVSNHHVIFFHNAKLPQKIGSPGTGCCSCCCAKNVVGRARWLGKRGNIGAGNSVYIDCAMVPLDAGIQGVNSVPGLSSRYSSKTKKPLLDSILGKASAELNERVVVAAKGELIPGIVEDVSRDVPLMREDGPVVALAQIVVRVDPGYERDIVEGAGDSGAAVINEDNQIIGIMHARASTEDPRDQKPAPLIVASPIDAVLDALGIDLIAAPPSNTSGELLYDVPPSPPVRVPQGSDIEDVLRRHEALFRATRTGHQLMNLGYRHGREVNHLINHCRAVTVAWHRGHGPAWTAHVLKNLREPDYGLPAEVKGVSQLALLERMAHVLAQHGSANLQADLERHVSELLRLAGASGVQAVLDELAARDASGGTPS